MIDSKALKRLASSSKHEVVSADVGPVSDLVLVEELDELFVPIAHTVVDSEDLLLRVVLHNESQMVQLFGFTAEFLHFSELGGLQITWLAWRFVSLVEIFLFLLELVDLADQLLHLPVQLLVVFADPLIDHPVLFFQLSVPGLVFDH